MTNRSLYLGPNSKKGAFANSATHPLVLDLILIDVLGPEYFQWEPETIWAEVKYQFGVECSEVNRNKIQAAKTCHVSDLPYNKWDVFEKVGVSFANSIPLFSEMQRLTPHSCAAAVSTMSKIRDEKLSDEVIKYCAASFMDDGVVYAPPPLLQANEHLLKLGVPKQTHTKVKALMSSAYTPDFDGTNDLDIQVYKTQSINDYVAHSNRTFKRQLTKIFKKD